MYNYFSDLKKIVDFLNTHECRRGLEWQTIVAMQLDTNERQPIDALSGTSVAKSLQSITFGWDFNQQIDTLMYITALKIYKYCRFGKHTILKNSFI